MPVSAEHPEIVPGAMIKIFDGPFQPRWNRYGLIVAVKTERLLGSNTANVKSEMLLYLPTHPKQLCWHHMTESDFTVKRFQIVWTPNSQFTVKMSE